MNGPVFVAVPKSTPRSIAMRFAFSRTPLSRATQNLVSSGMAVLLDVTEPYGLDKFLVAWILGLVSDCLEDFLKEGLVHFFIF